MENLTPETMQLNEVQPPSFCAPPKSLITEIEKLREAVLILCDLHKQLAAKVDATLLGHGC